MSRNLYVDFRPVEAFDHELLGTLVIMAVNVWGLDETTYHPLRLDDRQDTPEQKIARFCEEYEASYGPIPACPDGRQN